MNSKTPLLRKNKLTCQYHTVKYKRAATQGAGTPNQVGLGFFLPMMVSDNGVLFLDVLANANFADFGDYSSIINTEVDGTTLSTSTRIGSRWLTDDKRADADALSFPQPRLRCQ